MASGSNNGTLTSMAVLSMRIPLNAGCLGPPPVYSRYSTSHTRSGSEQRASRVIARGGAVANGLVGRRKVTENRLFYVECRHEFSARRPRINLEICIIHLGVRNRSNFDTPCPHTRSICAHRRAPDRLPCPSHDPTGRLIAQHPAASGPSPKPATTPQHTVPHPQPTLIARAAPAAVRDLRRLQYGLACW